MQRRCSSLDVHLITIGKDDFLDAVTSSDAASTVAWRSIEQLLTDGAHDTNDRLPDCESPLRDEPID